MTAKDRWMGLVRELMMGLGGGLVAFGYNVEAWWPEATGLVLACLALVFAIRANEGLEVMFSLVRKIFSAAGGALVAMGMLTPEKAAALMGFLGPLIAIVWTTTMKGDRGGGAMSLVFFAGLVLLLFGQTGCTVSIDPITGQPVVGADAAAVQAITEGVVAEMNEALSRPGK